MMDFLGVSHLSPVSVAIIPGLTGSHVAESHVLNLQNLYLQSAHTFDQALRFDKDILIVVSFRKCYPPQSNAGLCFTQSDYCKSL